MLVVQAMHLLALAFVVLASAPPVPAVAPTTPLPPAPAAATPAPTPARQQPETTPDGKTVYPGPKGKKIAFPLELYDESADGAMQVQAALARAMADNRRVLVMWGENYCGFCSELHDLLEWEVPRLRALVESEYEFVKIDLGKQFSNQKHLDLAKSLGTDIRAPGGGAPALTIIDPLTSKGAASLAGSGMLAKPMTMQRVYDEQMVFGFLSDNRAIPKVAMSVVSEQLVFAGRAGKKLLVWFGEPESAASAELHRWFNDPAVAETLGAGYLILKVDPQRMTTGRLVMDRITEKPGAPCPFIAILDSMGRPVDAGALLAGYPSTPSQRSALRAAFVAHGPAINPSKLDAALAKLPETPAEPKPRGPAQP